MQRLTSRTESVSKPPLSRADWLSAALQILVSDGIDSVQITRLAKALVVTRGSFYWHFESRADLLDALLNEWRSSNSEGFNAILVDSDTLDDGILAIFGIWVEDDVFRPELDQAIRDWARLDIKVQELVRKEDVRRVSAIANHFRRFGFIAEDAEVRARVLYFSQIGYVALNLGEAMTERLALLEPYFVAYTGRELDQAAAGRFVQKIGVFE